MAKRLILDPPFHGMPYLWNISANVGPLQGTPNNPADVQLVKYLASLTKGWAPTYAASCLSLPLNVSTQFDAVLGFWIGVWGRAFFASEGGDTITIVPAVGSGSSIMRLLNEIAFQLSPAGWGETPAHLNLLPELRNQFSSPSALSTSVKATAVRMR